MAVKNKLILPFFLFILSSCSIFAQNVDTTAQFGIYYMIQEPQRIQMPQKKTGDPIDSTNSQFTDSQKKESISDAVQIVQDDSIKRTINAMQAQIDNLQRKLNNSLIVDRTAGYYLENAANDEITSLIVACVGAGVAGFIAAVTIPHGGNALLGGSISSGIIFTASGITSFVLHCKALKKAKKAGEQLSILQL